MNKERGSLAVIRSAKKKYTQPFRRLSMWDFGKFFGVVWSNNTWLMMCYCERHFPIWRKLQFYLMDFILSGYVFQPDLRHP